MQNQNINSNSDTRRGVEADYLETGVCGYDENPLIEALPPILDLESAVRKLSFYPRYNDQMREHPNHLRYHSIQAAMKFFQPLDIHLDLERRFSCALRSGYANRSPLQKDYWGTIEGNFEIIDLNSSGQYKENANLHSTTASGFNIVGISGIGKSQAIEQILSTYPKVIFHSRYKEQEFRGTQIVSLKLDCPFDSSIKGLCLGFFQAVDNLLGTNYLKNYGGSRQSIDEMLIHIARIATNHFLGILVIDEIQRLSNAKIGGAEKMLNFFVQLVNVIGVPVVLVGTYKAVKILSGTFSQMRRGTGQGDGIWNQMQNDKQWDVFVNALWKYQFTRKKCALQETLSKALYEESQGITDLAIKTYMFAQERAIETGREIINASIIRSAAHDKFKIIRPALDAIKRKDENTLNLFEDLYSEFIKEFLSN